MDKLPRQRLSELRSLRQIRVRKARRLLGLLLLAAAAAISVGVARGVVGGGSAAGSWVWPQGLGGQAVQDRSGLVSGMAFASRVRGPLRVIATGRSGRGSLSLVAGTNASSDVCIGYTQQDDAQGLQFQCLAPDDPHTVLWVGGSGGRTASATDWTSLAGVVRSDVARVVLLLADGGTRDLTLNAQRAFTYYADSRTAPETALTTYAVDGSKLETVDLRSVASPLNP
jgi:hypothetical protein